MTTHLRTQQQQQSHTPTRNIHVMTNAIIMTYNRLQSIEGREREKGERRGGRERKEGREKERREGGREEGGREGGREEKEGEMKRVDIEKYPLYTISRMTYFSPPLSLSPSILSLSLSPQFDCFFPKLALKGFSNQNILHTHFLVRG